MSLTSIFTHPRYQELQTRLKEDFPKPYFGLTGEMDAPPRTENYSTIGTAFDYLFRFYFQHRYPETTEESWLAESVISRFKDSGSITSFEGKNRRKRTIYNIIKQQLNEARQYYQEFLKTGIFKDDLLRSTILMAQLDCIGRSSYYPPELGIYQLEDVEDLKALTDLLNLNPSTRKIKCYPNPTFGEGTRLMFGADADFIIDDTLIEIKTIIRLELSRRTLNQLIGYYVLSLIGGVADNKNARPIKRISVYFARHGQIWDVSIEELGSKEKFEEFKDWLINFMKRFGRLV
jgi:hypothetical protein